MPTAAGKARRGGFHTIAPPPGRSRGSWRFSTVRDSARRPAPRGATASRCWISRRGTFRVDEFVLAPRRDRGGPYGRRRSQADLEATGGGDGRAADGPGDGPPPA